MGVLAHFFLKCARIPHVLYYFTHPFGQKVWATSLYHYEGPEGWEEPGIERKPAFTRLSVVKLCKRRAPSEDGDGVPPPINRGNGSPWYVLTEKRPPSQVKASFFAIERKRRAPSDEIDS